MASSSSREEYEYEVFLSFRGEDTRRGFTGHLYDALHKKNIRTFMDDKEAETGYKISPQLRKAIMGSKIWMIVFSKDFASSTWCLDEVLQILECNRIRNGEIKGNVIPIFYGIKPSIVRKQEESYAVAFAKHAERFKDRIEMVEQWRDALNEVSGVTGHDSEDFRYDQELVDKIITDVLLKLPKDRLTIDHFKRNLIGIEERVKDIEPFLCIDSEDDVRIIGIWGMGGIGKTTLAHTVFGIYKSSFDADCFLENVREKSKRQGKEHWRMKLLFHLLKDKSILKDTPFVMSTFIQKWLGRKKVIVVLDDMDEILSLKYFLEGHEQFAPGSRIIVTTRNMQLLRSVTDKIYKVKGLDYYEALNLFHKHAFGRQISVTADYEALSERAITRANGNPLALKVLGSFLCSKSKQEWESALDKQAIEPHEEILQVLEISYVGLSKGTQNMFLDIACFITDEVYREEVENMFSCSDHYDVTTEITDLIDKSLLTESPYGYLSMHDLLREMGQKIVRAESTIPRNRSRLWTAKDVRHVLEKNKGTDAIQGILLNLSDGSIKENLQVSCTAFSNMCHLRYLEIYGGKQYDREFWPGYLQNPCRYNVNAPKGLSDISDELRYFRWDSCPLKYLPNFNPENLVGLIMRGSKLEKLWNEVQLLDLEKLKKIDLSYSDHLTGILNLSGAINLEIINLQGCENLVQIHLDLQNLRKLQFLDISYCYNLEKCGASESQEVPSSVPVGVVFSYCTGFRSRSIHRNEIQLKKINASYCKHLTEIPNLSGAINLETITLSGCTSLVQVALNFQNHPKLQILDLTECINLEECKDSENIATNSTAFIEEETSSSVPVELYFSSCKRLRSIPESIGKLKYLSRLELSGCPNLQMFPEISSSRMECLHKLSLQGMKIEELPESIENIKKLEYLSLKDCERLKSLPQSIWKLKYLEELIVLNCPNLQGKFPEIWDVMECLCEIDLGGTGIGELPESIENIERLIRLNLKDCKRLKSLPQSIWKLKYLQKLIVRGCPNLQGKFPEICDVMECLCEIDLGGTGIEELPESIENIKKLKYLSLKDCKRLKSLPQSIWKLKCLEKLIVPDCPNLQGKFPEIWDVMECLYEIDLGGTGIEELPESIANIQKLKHLNLEYCERLKSLPQSIWKLKYLEKLIVRECPNLQGKFPEIWDVMECLYEIDLGGSGIEELPESIENIKKLKHLNLKDCKRLKSLPQSICKLKYLQNLIVPNCPNLQEKFPEIWDGMECLYEINLWGTGIEELPESIENIEQLRHLNLKDCKRLKSLPQSIWKLKYLEILIVHGCPNLQGKFPEICDVMEYLYIIDLGGTGIEELPESIENLSGLTALNLGSCPQIKFLPNSLCKLSRLVELSLKECSSLEELPRLPLSLTKLDIQYCESLKSIQRLPSSLYMFEAAGCTSMKTISSCESGVICNRQDFGFLCHMFWRFENCMDLDHNTCNHIIADTVNDKFYGPCSIVDIVFPGDEIPKWFNNASTDDGNSINFRPTNSLIPFVVCFVGVLNNFDDHDHDKQTVSLKYNINFKTNTSDGRVHQHTGLPITLLLSNAHNADHVFIIRNQYMCLDGRVLGQLIGPHWCLNGRNVDTLQASFSICLMEGVGVNLNIKKCGIRFLYDR